ncbi:MAG: FAD-binding oxidoreductase [Candidatus Aminicenantes bacterium]
MNDDPLKTAQQCRHYAMCKIDYLKTGLCPSGPKKRFTAYYPQGRMDIYAALKQNLIPLTKGLVDIAETCTLCGICDRQCHFITGMKPVKVMKSLKQEVKSRLNKGEKIQPPPEDSLLGKLQKITGRDGATNDPAVLITYSDDPYPLKEREMPRGVVLPGSTEETAAVVKLAVREQIPWVVRGNGASVYGMVFTSGIVIDMNRMQDIEIDPENWTAAIGAGVTSFDLQQAVRREGFRVNTAEPAATVCGNIICTGLFSTWGAAYGTMDDNFVDMEFVDKKGRIFHLSDPDAPNLYAYEHKVKSPPGICTQAKVPLYPVTEDEECLLVPFSDFDSAVHLARELNVRRIGLSIAVLGPHYIAAFLSPTLELSQRLKENLGRIMGIESAVFVVTDAHGRRAVEEMAGPVIDQGLLRTLMLGLPRLLDKNWLDFLETYQSDRPPYEILCDPDAAPLLETILQPSPETAAQTIDEDLRGFYTSLFKNPEYTDGVWLSMYRIVSSRMCRHKHVFAFLIYLPPDDLELINHINSTFADTAEEFGIDYDFGFITPMDMGKRAVYEYDYYIDQASSEEKKKAGKAMERLVPWLDKLAMEKTGVTWIKTFFSQGCVRKNGFFYQGFHSRKPHE